VPWLDEQLDVSRSPASERSASSQGTPEARQTGVLLNQRASSARRRLHKVLEQWVSFCLEHQVRNSAPTQEEPPRMHMARWPSGSAGASTAWPGGPRRTTRAAASRPPSKHAREVVLWKPPVRVFLGKCGLPIPLTDGRHQGGRCQGDVYAAEDATALNDVGHCRSCGQKHLVAGMREKLEAELDSRLCTAAEIARMMVYLGADGSSDKLRDRVTQPDQPVAQPRRHHAHAVRGHPRGRRAALPVRRGQGPARCRVQARG
jgi:hypothetical protein